MKNLKKKLAALGVGLAVMASSATAISASAWTKVEWPGFYTPKVGNFTASVSRVQVTNMRWTSDQTTAFNPPLQPTPNTEQNGVEFEFRPKQVEGADGVKRYTPHDIWSNKTSETSNLPMAYFEFQPYDDDDIAICCGDLKFIEAEKTYYGTMGLEKSLDLRRQLGHTLLNPSMARGRESQALSNKIIFLFLELGIEMYRIM